MSGFLERKKLLLLQQPVVTPTTYYVAPPPEGDNANDGSAGAPWATLSYGVAQLASGDTLLVKNGTYTKWANGTPEPGYSWSFPTIIQNYPGHTPKITANAGQHTVSFIGTHYVVLRGFEIDGTGGVDGVNINWTSSLTEVHHIRVQNCDIHSWSNQGIGGSSDSASGPPSGCQFIDNRIHDGGVAVNLDHGIYLAAPDTLIDGNEIYNCFALGIHIYNSSSTHYAFNNVIRNNHIHDNAVSLDGAGILLGDGSGHLCYNNIVTGNECGIRVDYSQGNMRIYNNTIYDNNRGDPQPGMQISKPGCIVKNNIIWGHATPIHLIGVTIEESNNVTTDPLFVAPGPDSPGTQYRVRLGSPAIDAGTTLADVTLDYFNNRRPYGAAPDAGVFEFPWIESGTGASLNFTTPNGHLIWEMGRGVSHYLYHTVAAVPEIWVQFSIQIPTAVTHTEEGVFMIPIATNTANYIIRMQVRQAPALRLYIGTRNDALATTTDFATLVGTPPQTYLVDLRWKRASAAGANDGLVELYVDGAGTPAKAITGIDNDGQTTWSRVAFGSLPSLLSHETYDCILSELKIGTTRGGIDILNGGF